MDGDVPTKRGGETGVFFALSPGKTTYNVIVEHTVLGTHMTCSESHLTLSPVRRTN